MNPKLSPRRRALSLLLALLMALELLPGAAFAAEEAGVSAAPAGHWAAGYLNQMVEWGFIRADQAGDPDRQLTRADFMAIVNRAYGYNEVGPTPFEDVSEYDWFYDDVGIAYTARYINGTSATTASPNDTLDRESAATILGRNMMLQESAGEILDFTDARDISSWARGTIKSSMEHYLVTGYDDGTFRPQQAMNWGEIAALVTRTIGTPLQDAGDYSLGGVFGNVTVTSPGVTLRDTVVSGDLYITGGVGLGGIKLENVTVLGRIIASGTGTSEGGASILMRNVTADELLVDNLQDKEVSIQADGITEIGKTTVRSSAYIEDNTPDGLGLHMISFEGDWYGEDEEVPEGWEPPKLTLAGRVEEVVNRTPNSTVHAAKGTVSKLTVDEEATDSQVIIDRGTVVKDLVLDTGVNVTGEGDVTKLEVNAPGSNVAMIPDDIYIRPGITTIIAGEEMDSTSAEEFALEPLILSGYPKIKDITPTSAQAVFSTNKQGTIHWAVSAITDGSVGVDDLLEPPSYGNIALRYGTLTSPRGNEETAITITGLIPDGSYYLSAVLEDARGEISPLKVVSFTTPDNSVPAFNQGYPYMSMTTRAVSQATVSVNKACTLYYALYAVGAAAPTTAELKAGSVAGSYGYGVVSLEKNTEFPITVNNRPLKEQEDYIVYFWLTDGVNSSAVSSLTFTTDDETLPYFLDGYPRVTAATNNSVTLTFRINENGRVFWVIRPEGDTTYPLPEPGQTGTAPLESLFAKTQVASENPAINAVADTDGRIVINGLEPEKAYDLYYLCQDTAGNYCLAVEKMTIRTADGNGPKIIGQYFDSFTGTDNTQNPKADTAIDLVFSENICSRGTIQTDFNTLYQETKTAADHEQALSNFVTALRESIVLWKKDSTGTFVRATDREFPYREDEDPNNPYWDIDYAQAEVSIDSATGQLTVTFPDEALNLESGGTYRFVISEITDNATPRKNLMVDENGNAVSSITMPEFYVSFASVTLTDSPGLESDDNGPQKRTTENVLVWAKDEDGDEIVDENGKPVPEYVDSNTSLYFRMTIDSTESIEERIAYDILLWNQETLAYQLYYRIVDKKNDTVLRTKEEYQEHGVDPLATANEVIDKNGWIYLGDTRNTPRGSNWQAKSVNRHINGCGANQFPKLETLSKDLAYEFVIDLTFADNTDDPTKWTGRKTFRAQVVAGLSNKLYDLAGDVAGNWEELVVNGSLKTGAVVISNMDEENKWLEWSADIHDTNIPKFLSPYPQFLVLEGQESHADDSITMRLRLDRRDTYIYYVFGKVDKDGNPEFTTTVPETVEAPKPVYVEQDYTPNQDSPNDPQKDTLITEANGDPVYKYDTGNTETPIIAADNARHPVLWKKNGKQMYYTKTTGTYTDDPDAENIEKETIRNPYGLANATAVNGRLPIDVSKVPLSGAQTPDGLPLFEVAVPSRDEVYDPENNWQAAADTDLYGEIPYTGSRYIDYTVGPDIEQELEPNTTYLAYFVLKGKYSDMSEVYVYKFTTADTPKPRIVQQESTNEQAKDGDIDVSTHVASNGQYRVVTVTAAQNTIDILKEPFSKYAYTAKELETVTAGRFKAIDGAIGTPGCYTQNDGATGGTTFTVLDALRTSYLQSNSELSNYRNDNYYIFPETQIGYTVFDYYANEDARNLVYQMIRTPDQSVSYKVKGVLDVGDPKLPDGITSSSSRYWDKYMIATQLDPADEDRYYSFVYTVNNNTTVKDGEEYKVASFSAYRFGLGQLSSPEVSLVEITLQQDTGGKYKGYIDVFFEKSTYLHNMTGEAQSMTTTNLLASLFGHQFTKFPDSDSKMTATSADPSVFRIEFSSVSPGGSNFANRYFANADNGAASKPLTFQLTESGGKATLVARWGGVEKGSATIDIGTTQPDAQLNFDNLSYSSSSGKYSLTLNGSTPETVTGRLNGTGTITGVTISPTNANSKLADTAAAVIATDKKSFTIQFTGKALGANEDFTITALVDNGEDFVRVSRTITVSVGGGIKIESITPSNDTSEITPNPATDPTATTFEWNRKDNGQKTAVITLVGDPLSIDNSLRPTATSNRETSLSVGTPSVANGKITVTIRYLSAAGDSAVVTINVGNEEKKITIHLKGVSDMGTTAITAGKNPF